MGQWLCRPPLVEEWALCCRRGAKTWGMGKVAEDNHLPRQLLQRHVPLGSTVRVGLWMRYCDGATPGTSASAAWPCTPERFYECATVEDQGMYILQGAGAICLIKEYNAAIGAVVGQGKALDPPTRCVCVWLSPPAPGAPAGPAVVWLVIEMEVSPKIPKKMTAKMKDKLLTESLVIGKRSSADMPAARKGKGKRKDPHAAVQSSDSEE